MNLVYLIGAVVLLVVIIVLLLKVVKKLAKLGLFIFLVGIASFVVLKLLNLI